MTSLSTLSTHEPRSSAVGMTTAISPMVSRAAQRVDDPLDHRRAGDRNEPLDVHGRVDDRTVTAGEHDRVDLHSRPLFVRDAHAGRARPRRRRPQPARRGLAPRCGLRPSRSRTRRRPSNRCRRPSAPSTPGCCSHPRERLADLRHERHRRLGHVVRERRAECLRVRPVPKRRDHAQLVAPAAADSRRTPGTPRPWRRARRA